jgi:hypothetical protein
MTRPFNTKVECPFCHKWHTAETAMERWVRNRPELDSSAGIVRFDLDILLHRYMTPAPDGKGCRDIQCMMFVEVKTFNAVMLPAQQDTLSLLSQVLRNRKTNMYHDKRGLHADNHTPLTKVKSRKTGRTTVLKLFGGHVLTLSGDSPENSDTMTWDIKHRISLTDLIKLLRFEIDPDHMGLTDWRRRSFAISMVQRQGSLL